MTTLNKPAKTSGHPWRAALRSYLYTVAYLYLFQLILHLVSHPPPPSHLFQRVNTSCFATTAAALQLTNSPTLSIPVPTSSSFSLPTANPTPTPSGSPTGGLSTGIVAAIAVAAVVGAAVPFVGAMAYFAAKRRRQNKNNEDTGDSDGPTSAAAAQQEGDVTRQSALPPSVNVVPSAAPPEGAAVWTFAATPPTGGPPAPILRPTPPVGTGSTGSTDSIAAAFPQLPNLQTRAFMFDNPSYSPMAHANSPKVPSAATAEAAVPSSPTITLITDDTPAVAAAAAAPPNGPPSNASRARSRLGNNNAGSS